MINAMGIQKENIVVFISAIEENVNVIPWKEADIQIHLIPLTNNAAFNYTLLQQYLQFKYFFFLSLFFIRMFFWN